MIPPASAAYIDSSLRCDFGRALKGVLGRVADVANPP